MRACFRVGAFVLSAGVATISTGASLAAQTKAVAPAPAAKPKPAPGAPAKLSPEIISKLYTGDFDGMVKRRMIRDPRAVQQDELLHRQGHAARHRLRGRGQGRGGDQHETEDDASRRRFMWSSCRRRAMRSTTRSSRGAATSSLPGVTVTPERAKLVDFTIPTQTERQGNRRDGAGCAGAHDASTACRARPWLFATRASSSRAAEGQRHVQAAGQGADDDPDGADGARGRRHPRNGQRRSPEGRRRR